MTTTNGKDGGLLKGKRHYDKNGKPLGGIKAVVSDTGQAVELEGGEVIINREASKKHWKELSRINQSAGNGVPILPPDSVESNTDEYKLGGRTIEFNPNHLPNKWVYEYAKNIKDKYPKVWDLGGNQFGNEAFKNLERALKRGYWTDNEEWMYVKWQSFNARHKGDIRIAGVIANLKWLNKVEKGWGYMKNLIENEIAKKYPKNTGWKFKKGGELAKGIKSEQEHKGTLEKLYKHKITPSQAPTYIAKDHLKEDKKYYTKLNKMEKKFTNGGNLQKAGLGSLKVGDKGTFKNQQVEIVQITDDRIYFKQGNDTLYRGIERFATRWKDSGGSKAKPNNRAISEFQQGQYVRLIGSTKLYKVVTITTDSQNNNDFVYKIETVLNGIKEKDYIPENQLLDAIAKHNLPFIEADTIVNENNEDMTIVKIDGSYTKFLDDNQQVVQYKGMDLWMISDVLRNLDSGLWKLHKTGVVKPKALPYKIGDIVVDTLKVPNKKYVVHDIATGVTYLREENTPNVTDFYTDGVLKLLESGAWYIQKQATPTLDLNLGFAISTPTKQKSKLTYLQQGLVRTDAFKKYFGDWEKSAKDYTADGFKNFDTHYKGVSKVIDLVTLEPRLMYHGTMTEKEFYVFDASRKNKGRPYSYFAQNIEYSQHFTQSSQRNKGTEEVLYKCFLRVLKPFNAIGTNFEAKKEEYGWWVSVISLAITQDKYTINYTTEQLEKTIKAVESQIGAYIKEICGGNGMLAQPFWIFMARDKKSTFKAFLMSYDYDGINYAENYTEPYDINNPSEYTMAVTLFDSDQIKLGDGRNLDFDKMNPDIRYEEGGNLHQQEKTHQPELDKKHKLGKALFGDKYQYEDGGNLIAHPTHHLSEERAYVDDIITKMKK